MGAHLAHAAGEPARFAGLVQGAWQAYLAHHRSLVVAAAGGRTGYPAWWHDSLRVIRERLDRRLAHPADVPLEYATLTGAPAIDALRRDVQRFARLLAAWPALRRAAGTLAERVAGDPAWLRP